MFNYDESPKKVLLICRCYRCDKDLDTSYMNYNFYKGLYSIEVKCHDEDQIIELTERQIESSNSSGWYWAFMDRA